MHIGVFTDVPAYYVNPAFTAKKAEDLGFESIWHSEHPIMPVHTETDWPGATGGVIPESYAHEVDPFVALACASGTTTTIKLATGITLVPERNPLLLAKEVATLDLISGGRFLFGIGAGWLKEETEIMGGDFEHRWSQVREAVLVMKELWTRDEAEFHGRFYDFPPVKSFPKPAQKPHPPVLLGGTTRRVFKRIVEWGDGWLPNRVTPEQVREGRAILDSLAADAGRGPASISISVFGRPPEPDLVNAFEDAGADRVVVLGVAAETEEAMSDELRNL